MTRTLVALRTAAARVALVAALAGVAASHAAPAWAQQVFATAEAAAAALVDAARSGEPARLRSLFGPEADFFVGLSEPERFAQRTARFLELAQEALVLESKDAETRVVRIGKSAWPFAVPIARKGGGWQFDVASGKEELLNRVIGENELVAIEACRAYVRAQQEYALADRDGDDVLEYAQRIGSTPGARDGLYWEAARQRDRSPLPSTFAAAALDPAPPGRDAPKPDPLYGYVFRVLAGQGSAAPGGAHSYVINGNMIAGHAMIAAPERWGESGVMTFIVGPSGRVYQKNLGPDTAAAARRIVDYDPDSSWTLVTD